MKCTILSVVSFLIPSTKAFYSVLWYISPLEVYNYIYTHFPHQWGLLHVIISISQPHTHTHTLHTSAHSYTHTTLKNKNPPPPPPCALFCSFTHPPLHIPWSFSNWNNPVTSGISCHDNFTAVKRPSLFMFLSRSRSNFFFCCSSWRFSRSCRFFSFSALSASHERSSKASALHVLSDSSH